MRTDYISLIYSILFAIGSFVYYRIHKWWRHGRDEDVSIFKPNTTIGTIKDWIMIVALAITSIVFLIRSF